MTLPSFSRGLKLIRLAVFVMLLQLAAMIVLTVKALGADEAEAVRSFIEWTQRVMLINIAATLAMLVGVVAAIPELARARVEIGGLAIAAAGFAIAAAMVGWTYDAFADFIAVALDPSSTAGQLFDASERLDFVKYATVIKDLAYTIGLICVLRTVQRSAAVNDQLALRDEAGSMSRAIIVMLVADLFWQLTYGLGGSAGVFGVIGSLLVGAYWIYCHVRLARFLYNAAYFVNEPHDLPVATVVVRETAPAPAAAPPRAPAPAPVAPPVPPSVAAAPPVPRAPAPAPPADSPVEDGQPRFLR